MTTIDKRIMAIGSMGFMISCLGTMTATDQLMNSIGP